MLRGDTPLSVEIPAASAERPAWGKVGLIGAFGFVVGMLWPHFTNTRIAPNPPSDNASSAVPSAASAAVPPAPAVAPTQAAAATASDTVAVSGGVIIKCRDGKDDANESCGSLELDPIAVPKIKALAQCPAAAAASGKLSIGFDVDFHKKAVRVLLGKSTTLPRDKAEALVRCADAAFEKVSLGEVPHEHRRYTVFYNATFSPQAKSDEPSNDKPVVEGRAAGTTTSESPASGAAAVGWDVAIVRDAPKTGAIVGRVLRGSKVKVVAHQGEWYRVQYGSIEGWVYRGTIGL
jgi:hypothetical protein